jgi:hypothetical protein
MAAAINQARLRKLLAQGKTQREIAQLMKVPRTSLQRAIKQLDGESSPPVPAEALAVPVVSPPVVDIGILSPDEHEAVKSDFWEMIQWWRDRRLKQRHKSLPRDLQRQTYHVERRYIELIREEAETEGVSITEVVNRALGKYFARR